MNNMLAGIDEAGRGPVIGPMVVAIAMVEDDSVLSSLEVKDSKLLTDDQRKKLYFQLQKAVRYEYKIIGIKEIDRAVRNNKLNVLEMDAFAELINKLDPKKVIVDCPVKNTAKFGEELLSKLKKKTEVVAENKADLNHPVVSAASIIAKEIREQEIGKLKKKIGLDFGSGYPSDPKTKEFLKEHWNHFDIFRKSWQTYKQVKNDTQQRRLI